MNLCNRVKYFKESQKGVSEMCQLVEDYAEEYAKKRIKENNIASITMLLKNGASLELVQKSFPDFTFEEVEKIQKESQSK